MPQETITVTSVDEASSRQPASPSLPTPRQLREQRWQQLLKLQMLLTRIMVERTLHGYAEEADAVARQVVAVEEDLERLHKQRWLNRRAALLEVESSWWLERHSDDVLTCNACRVLNGASPEEINIPAPRMVWN